MVEGIRYLDKYQDFGNINGFDNKQSNALDVSIKDKYKNKITGDFKALGGHESKYLSGINLFRFGGQLKFGLIGNWNTLGKQSITAFEYDELRGIGLNEVDKNGFRIERTTENSPKFLDPTVDVSDRTNLFGALSLIYKPTRNTKFSLLNITSRSKQRQRLLNTRRFFELTTADQMELSNKQGDFFLNTSIIEFGYQPTKKSFFEYIMNFNPQNTNEKFKIDNTIATETTRINQVQDDNQYTLDQKLTYLTKISSKTLLKGTGILILEKDTNKLHIESSTPAFVLEGFDTLQQTQKRKRILSGFQFQTVSKFQKETLRLKYGTILSGTEFINFTNNREEFANDFESNRMDSYLNASYEGKLFKRLLYTTTLEYNFIRFERFEESFNNSLFSPSLKLDYRISTSKNLNFKYAYDVRLPVDQQVHPNSLVNNYFSIKLPSQVKSDQLLPKHLFELFYSNFKMTTGSTFSTFINYYYSPTFLSFDNNLGDNNVVTSTNIIGKNQHEWNVGLNFDKRFKNKLGVFSNFNLFYSEEENSISGLSNEAKSSILKNRGGIYSRFRKGVNFNTGLDVELNEYNSSLIDITTKASAIKPYITLNGQFNKDKIVWSIGSQYAIYKTNLDESTILNIHPKITYTIRDNFEMSLEGNNILNINNAQITNNFNTINYSESSVIDTLEGYIVLGLYYRL